MAEPLKPCPFCGETPDIGGEHTFQAPVTSKWGCVVCCCYGPEIRTGYGPVEEWREDAITAWNQRTAIEATTDKLRQIEGVVADTFTTYAGAMKQIREVRAILAAQEGNDG